MVRKFAFEILNVNLSKLEQKVVENKDAFHELNQYYRSSYIVELYGIPFKKSKKCLWMSNKARRVANIEPGQVNVAHRTYKNKTAPIIILFHKKSHQQKFYKQKKKCYSFYVSQFLDDVPEEGDDQMDEEDLKKMLHFPEHEPYWKKQENDYRPQKTSKDFALQIIILYNKCTGER